MTFYCTGNVASCEGSSDADGLLVVSPSNGSTQTCTSRITNANLHWSMLMDEAQERKYDSSWYCPLPIPTLPHHHPTAFCPLPNPVLDLDALAGVRLAMAILAPLPPWGELGNAAPNQVITSSIFRAFPHYSEDLLPPTAFFPPKSRRSPQPANWHRSILIVALQGVGCLFYFFKMKRRHA